MIQPKHFAAAMQMLGETFRTPLTDGLLEGYWIALQRVPEASLKRAIARSLAECRFMPTPAELLAYVRAERNEANLAAGTERVVKLVQEWRPDPKLLEAIRETVSELATAKDANRPHVLQREPTVVTEEEKRQTLERAAAMLAARRAES